MMVSMLGDKSGARREEGQYFLTGCLRPAGYFGILKLLKI
jgi:hypothetical protein